MNDAFSVSGFFRWNRPGNDREEVFETFARSGTRFLAVDAETTLSLPEKPEKMKELCRKAAKANLVFRDAHAPWGPGRDLNEITNEEIFSLHEKVLHILGENGIRTCTYHIGASCIYTTKDWYGKEDLYRSIALKALERLLKTAEQYQLTLCVENCFEPSTTAQEAVKLVKHFDSPWIGLCLDCGHANLMEPMEGREVTKMVSYIQRAWEKSAVPLFTPGIAELMSPEIVTVHVHDNDGLNDKHAVPDEYGTIDWKRLKAVLRNSPRLLSLQSEAGDSEKDPFNAIEHVSKTLQDLWL
jgi:sugar phosphate isomerase/epimerase